MSSEFAWYVITKDYSYKLYTGMLNTQHKLVTAITFLTQTTQKINKNLLEYSSQYF